MATATVLSPVNRVLNRRDTSSAVAVPAGKARRRVKVLASATAAVLESTGATCTLTLEVDDGRGWREYANCVFTTGPQHATDPRPSRLGLPPEPPGLIVHLPSGWSARAALVVAGQRKVMGVVIDVED